MFQGEMCRAIRPCDPYITDMAQQARGAAPPARRKRGQADLREGVLYGPDTTKHCDRRGRPFPLS
jgi:hypothetical protein